MTRISLIISSASMFSVGEQNALSNGEGTYSLTIYVYAYSNELSPVSL